MILAPIPSQEASIASVMPDYPHLVNAPIQEALIDLRCKLPDGFDVSVFTDLKEEIGDSYPVMKSRQVVEAQFGIRDEAAFSSTDIARVDGYFFRSADGKRLVQFRLDGFTYNWLRPYDTWEALRREAKDRWRDYLSVVTPERVTRVALRYINRFSVELPKELRAILRVPPELPPEVPNRIAQFLFRWVVDDPETKARCNITQSSEESEGANKVDIILDIDCFVTEEFDAASSAIWDCLDELRTLKNRIFFECLTPQAMEMFIK